MLQPRTRWSVKTADQMIVKQIAEELRLTPLVATLLANRGITTPEAAHSFLYPSEDFHNPFLLNDMDKCVERIYRAIENQEKIVVYGDYDADGVTSTVVMLNALAELGANCDFYIPNRFTEGYGPNESAFRYLKNNGTDLIITVDNGISGLHEAQIAKEIGLDLIITDHHEPGTELPEAIAVIHPKRNDSTYPFKDLAGVGVSFKVASALLNRTPFELLPFVAIGTIADLVPLLDENRLIAKKGIQGLRVTNQIGLLALMKQAGINQQEITEETIGFGLAPRINAPGRIENAGIAVELFTSTEKDEVTQLASEIDQINSERQQIVNEIAEEAIAMVTEAQSKYDHKVIIAGKEGWHAGVIGIVASRLVEQFYRPVIVLSFDSEKGLAKGSARSIPGFNLFENLSQCKELLPHFGGHPMAAGMTLKISDVPELQARLNQLAKIQMTEEDFIPITILDGIFPLGETSLSAIEEMQALAPFGVENPKPKILIEDVHLPLLRKVGTDEKHLKLTLSNGEEQLDGIAFGLGNYADHISPLAKVSCIGELGINEWNNVRKPQILLKDLSVNEWQLFDYRGHKKLDQWIDKIPKENRKLIIFQKETITKLNLSNFQNETILIDSEEAARECLLDGHQVVLVDLPSNQNLIEALLKGKEVSRIYAHFYQEDTQFFKTIPTREHFKWFYALLLKNGVFDIRRYGNDIAKHRGWSTNTIHFMTKVFFELDFVTINNGIISVTKGVQKRDLSESKTYSDTLNMIQLEKDLIYSSYQQLKTWFDNLISLSNYEEAK